MRHGTVRHGVPSIHQLCQAEGDFDVYLMENGVAQLQHVVLGPDGPGSRSLDVHYWDDYKLYGR